MGNSFSAGVTLNGDDDAVEVVAVAVGFVVAVVVTGTSAVLVGVAFSGGVFPGVAVLGASQSVIPFLCLLMVSRFVCVSLRFAGE